MALTKVKLGKYIEQSDLRNNEGKFGEDSVVGLSTQKQMITTKADLSGVSLLSYKLFAPGQFAYIPDTSRRGDKMSLAYNSTKETYLVSSISVVFGVTDEEHLLSDYLYMFFNRPEFDRYARFHSWGSARETFNWEDMCDIDIELPDLPIQQKYVDIYLAALKNQQSYERGMEDLRIVFEGYLDNLRSQNKIEKIGPFLQLVEDKNDDLAYGMESVKGVSIEKKFIDTKADMKGVSLKPYYIVKPDEFAYVTVTSRNGEKISLALNDSDETYICSSSYVVFKSRDKEKLLPQYLMLYFSRSEFNRYARFHSWGSAREIFDWNEMCDVKIPVPDIKVQKAISKVFAVYTQRKEINEQLKAQIRDICSILIRGSLENGG